MTYPLSDSFCVRYNIGKPPLPYFTGQRFEVQSHIPPAPTSSKDTHYNPQTHQERDEIHPLERCFLHPPLPGATGSQNVGLKIVEAIRLGDNHSAQLGVVQILRQSDMPSLPDYLVAKFYDPLYFDHQQDDADPFLYVDYKYSNEAAVYNALKKFQGGAIPKYYGSYTLELKVDSDNGQLRHRHVRLILMEWIKGNSMRDLNPKNFSRSERQAIMKEIIDTETAFYTHDIFHRDVHPRNVLITELQNHQKRVTLIDFDKADVGRSPFPVFEAKMHPGVPISPLLRWHAEHGLREPFDGWVNWDWQPWLERLYDHTRGSITKDMEAIWKPVPVSELPPLGQVDS